MGRGAVDRAMPVAGGDARWSVFGGAGALVGIAGGDVAGDALGMIAKHQEWRRF